MLSSSPTCLRTALRPAGLTIPRTNTQSSSTAIASLLAQQCRAISSLPQRPSAPTSKYSSSKALSYRPKNLQSSTATRMSSTSATTTASPPTSSPTDQALSWDRYLQLRLIRRRYALVSSVLTSFVTGSTGAVVLAEQDLESLGISTFGLDPVVVMGMATLVCGASGWLVGPFAGNAVFGLRYRAYKNGIAVKEREFYQRIKRFRSDPAGQSMSNPLPDYYGEKISSVKGYRRWLKDQRAFRKKREA